MAKLIQQLTVLTTFLILGLVSANAFGQHADCHVQYQHIESLADEIEDATKALRKESVHYKHTDSYREITKSTRKLSSQARKVRRLVRREADIHDVEVEVSELDEMFHRVNNLFDRAEITAAHGYGHVHGNTAHVKRSLICIENAIHHMADDIATIRQLQNAIVVTQRVPYSPPHLRPAPVPAFVPARVPVPGCQSRPDYQGYDSRGHHSARGISIGGGSTQLFFGF